MKMDGVNYVMPHNIVYKNEIYYYEMVMTDFHDYDCVVYHVKENL